MGTRYQTPGLTGVLFLRITLELGFIATGKAAVVEQRARSRLMEINIYSLDRQWPCGSETGFSILLLPCLSSEMRSKHAKIAACS